MFVVRESSFNETRYFFHFTNPCTELVVVIGDSGNVDKPTVFPDDKTTHILPPPCRGGCKPIDKPIVDTSATVYVVFGLKSIDRSKIIRESVITKKVNSL